MLMDETRIVNGTVYHEDTNPKVINWLETSRERRQRIRIFYGKDGKPWNEEYNTIGHVSRSVGPAKVPILIYNARSRGGVQLFDDCIYRIDTKNRQGRIYTVYRDHSVREHRFVSTDTGSVYDETEGRLYARCASGDAGRRLAAFMNGDRWSK